MKVDFSIPSNSYQFKNDSLEIKVAKDNIQNEGLLQPWEYSDFPNMNDEEFKSLADGIKEIKVEIKSTRFEFSVHEETKRIIVKVYDRNTDKLIAEIPPEKILDLIAGIWKEAGLIVDKKV